MSELSQRLWQGSKRELGVAARTFFVVWPILAALQLGYTIVSQWQDVRGLGDLLLTLVIGFVILLAYMFWPALLIALSRFAYRLVGLAAFVPIPVVLGGVALALYLSRHWLHDLLFDIFGAFNNVGPCGAHVGGPVAVLCLVLAMINGASIWALIKLILALSLVCALGVLPGALLWVALVTRALWKRLRAAA